MIRECCCKTCGKRLLLRINSEDTQYTLQKRSNLTIICESCGRTNIQEEEWNFCSEKCLLKFLCSGITID